MDKAAFMWNLKEDDGKGYVYRDLIDAKIQRPRLAKAFEEKNDEREVLLEWNKNMRGKTAEQQRAYLKTVEDPERAQNLTEANQAYESDQTASLKRSQVKAYSEAYDKVSKKMESDQPYTSILQMQQGPGMDKLLKQMTPVQRKSLKAMIENKTVTSPAAELELLNLIGEDNGNTLFNTTPAQLNLMRAKLSKQDWNWLKKQWHHLRTQTDSQQRTKLGWAQNMMVRSLIDRKLIPADETRRRKKHTDLQRALQFDLIDVASSFPASWSQDKIKQYTDGIADRVLQNKIVEDDKWPWEDDVPIANDAVQRFQRKPVKKEEKEKEEKKLAPVSGKNTVLKESDEDSKKKAESGKTKEPELPALGKLSVEERKGWRKKFLKEKGRSPKGFMEFRKFIQQNKAKDGK
jgi:hypothetical protein